MRAWLKTWFTCVVIYTTAWTIPLLPHFPYTWATGPSWPTQFLRGIICMEPGRGLGLLHPHWLWHLFNAGPSVFTRSDKSSVCRPRPGWPLACTDSTATHSLTGFALWVMAVRKMLIFQALFSSPRGEHSSLGNTHSLYKTSGEITDCWSLFITLGEGGIRD